MEKIHWTCLFFLSVVEGYYFSPHKQNNGDHQRGSSQDKIQGTRSGMLSAKDLTGAPLISYVPSNNRKLRKSRQFQPLEKKISEPAAGFRERHFSEQSSDVNPPSSLPPSNYYLGQNLYQVISRVHEILSYILSSEEKSERWSKCFSAGFLSKSIIWRTIETNIRNFQKLLLQSKTNGFKVFS